MTQPGTLLWFARHELRLAWRDWVALLTGGRRRRARTVIVWLVVVAALLHLLAFSMVAGIAEIGDDPDKAALLVITGSLLLAGALMLSQAMEAVTRAFYTRSDLDLILSSPAAASRLFAVRIAAMALSIAAMAMLVASPFIDMLAWRGGLRWLGAYGVAAAMGAAAAALAIALTLALFRLIGPRRTRLVAQIVAAVIGAAFVIGLQIAAILSYGTVSRIAFLRSDKMAALAPGPASLLWWPARAALGHPAALTVLLAASLALLAAAILLFAPRFGERVIAASGIASTQPRQRRGRTRFRPSSPRRALRRKEWALLRRDPWLLSQTLMQLLYLLPPAVLLWHGFGAGGAGLSLMAPILIVAAGQLAGGLAWLAISGEDAPDLVATAPVAERQVLRAKVEAVTGSIALVFAPFVLALALAAPWEALVTAAGIGIAAASATAIQLSFRAQARRSHFRRRHTSSRLATIAEALSSNIWAATGALAAAGTWLAAFTGMAAIAVLAAARLISPAKA